MMVLLSRLSFRLGLVTVGLAFPLLSLHGMTAIAASQPTQMAYHEFKVNTQELYNSQFWWFIKQMEMEAEQSAPEQSATPTQEPLTLEQPEPRSRPSASGSSSNQLTEIESEL